MLDNLGFGEIFFLGLLLFLFFGPERLPQLGARLGRWVANLTRYSGTFMNEWREEALAVHDAMEQVRGMREEIAAARAEIASTLHEARDDLGGAVEGARQDVAQQVQRATRFEVAKGPVRAAARGGVEGSAGQGEDAAIARTQQVVDGLRAKRAERVKLVQAASVKLPPEGDLREPGVLTVSEELVSIEGPSVEDLARVREQVRELAEEVEVLRTALAEVRAGLEARVAGVGVRSGLAL
jgi:Sec-independent protein translocase protein TatA